MTFDFDNYRPEPNRWFSTKIRYKGFGIANFSSPKGWVKGSTEIHFDETGRSSIEMKVDSYFVEDRIDTEHSDYNNFLWLINGRKPILDAPFVGHFGGSSDNICVDLTVEVKAFAR